MNTPTEPAALFPEWFGEVQAERHEEADDPVIQAWEARLIEAARNGSHDAYRELVDHHKDRIYRFCLSWAPTEEDAEEVCQDTFVRAFHALDNYRPRGKFSTWLYQIALNLSRDRARSKLRRMTNLTIPIHGIAETSFRCRLPLPNESSEWSEDLKRLEKGLNRLPARLREALLLNAVEGLPYEECAEVLSCSPRAIEGRIYRARRTLQQWWEDSAT